jgi:hypothetical protein
LRVPRQVDGIGGAGCPVWAITPHIGCGSSSRTRPGTAASAFSTAILAQLKTLSCAKETSLPFGPEHIADIGRPPRDDIVKKYGASFFGE